MEALGRRRRTRLACSLDFLPRLLPRIWPVGTFIATCDPSAKSRRSIRQHTLACVSIRQHTLAYVSIRQHTSALVKAYVSIHQH